MEPGSAAEESSVRVDLSTPDNSLLVRGRSRAIEALWIFCAAPVLASRIMVSSQVRVWLLRLFGADIGANVYLKPGIRVKFPWYLSIGDHCWIGEDVWIAPGTTTGRGGTCGYSLNRYGSKRAAG